MHYYYCCCTRPKVFYLVVIVLLLSLNTVFYGRTQRRRVSLRESTFHLLNETEVTGVVLINPARYRFSTDDWTPMLRYDCYEEDRFTSDKHFCWVDGRKGRMIVGLNGMSKFQTTVDGYERSELQKRGTGPNHTRVKNVSIWIRCLFEETLPRTTAKILIPFLNRTFPVSLFAAQVATAGGEGRIGICGRSPFGGIPPETIIRFIEFYKDVWKFDEIIIYDVGLSEVYLDEQLSKRLVELSVHVIDLNRYLKSIYGNLVNDVLFYSWAVAQNWMRIDCELRMRKLGVSWVFYPDFDEYLFPGRKFHSIENLVGGRYSIHEYLDSVPGYYWFSVGSLMASNNPTAVELGAFQFLRDEMKTHTELEWNKTTNFHGPFECSTPETDTRVCRTWNGRRKLFVSLLDPYRYFGMVDVHQIWYCGYGKVSADEFGVALNAEHQLYLRHYRAVNHGNESATVAWWE